MNIENIDRVIALRNYLEKANTLRRRVLCGSIECRLPGEINVFSVIESTPVRAAIVSACNGEIAKWEAELRELGVEFETLLEAPDPASLKDAAAPELYEAAKALLPADFHEHPDDFTDDWHALAAAIQKAENGNG
jgi:hypothetical protein